MASLAPAIAWWASPTPKAYVLGSEIRGHRESAGINTRGLAAALDMSSHSVISRWERGARVPSPEMVSAVCTVLSVSGSERDRLVDMAREAANEPTNSVSVGSAGEQDQLSALLEYERNATTITNVAPVLIPGPVQAPDYARAILGGVPQTDKMVSLRMGRREVITRRRNPARYHAYLLESVLHQPVCPSEAHRDQLEYLVELGRRDNIDIRVIPSATGFTPAHAGPFVLLEFERAALVVHLEHHRSSAFLRDEGDVQAFLDAREDIDQVAMSPDHSTKLIADVANRLEI